MAGPANVSEQAEAHKEKIERIDERVRKAQERAKGGADGTSGTSGTSGPDVDAPAPRPSALRVFVSPGHLNLRLLIRAGTLVKVPSANGPWDHSRTGDVWLEFREGIVRLDPADELDQLRIEWCEGLGRARDICRDIDDPQTAMWVHLVEQKNPTSRRDATLPANLDVEGVLDGDLTSLGQSALVARAMNARG